MNLSIIIIISWQYFFPIFPWKRFISGSWSYLEVDHDVDKCESTLLNPVIPNKNYKNLEHSPDNREK